MRKPKATVNDQTVAVTPIVLQSVDHFCRSEPRAVPFYANREELTTKNTKHTKNPSLEGIALHHSSFVPFVVVPKINDLFLNRHIEGNPSPASSSGPNLGAPIMTRVPHWKGDDILRDAANTIFRAGFVNAQFGFPKHFSTPPPKNSTPGLSEKLR